MIASIPGFLIFGIMSTMLLLGVFLRAKVKFFQNTMIPASLIGGVIGFALVSLSWIRYFSPDGEWVIIKPADFLAYTFHAFNISYISLCLTRTENSGNQSKVIKGGIWLTVTWCACLTIQALVGGGIVALYNLFSGGDNNVFLGFLVTHGFTQGPGQALAIGKIWEHAGVSDAATMGLIWAALGYLFAYLVGIPMARNHIKKGRNVNKRSEINNEEFRTGLLKKDTQTIAGKETTHSSTVETMAYHVALIGIVYILAYVIITVVRQSASNQVIRMIFSYPVLFFHVVYVSLILRKIMDKVGIGHLTDPGIQKRITGLSVDFLLVSSLMGISFITLSKYIGLIITVCIAVTAVTFFMIRFFAKRLTELAPERSTAIFGSCCGSTASGLLLLRVLDADFSTSVGLEIAYSNILLFFLLLPIISVIFALPSFGFMSIIFIYGAYSLVMLAAMWFIAKWNPADKDSSVKALT